MVEPQTPPAVTAEENGIPPLFDDIKSADILSEPASGPQDDVSILAELSLDTIGGQPWGIEHFRLIHGSAMQNIAIRYKAIDIWSLASTIEDLGEEMQAKILKLTAMTRSSIYTDETWLQSLACSVLGLDEPHILKSLQGKVVWNPAMPKACNLAEGMIALCQIGLTSMQIQQLANGISQLTNTRVQDESEALGNS